jgi:hypothetical protein
MSISVFTIAAVIYGYAMTSNRAEWSGYSLAAESLAQQRIEQARACKWDLGAVPAIDELVSANFPAQTNVLDIPISGTNVVWASNFTTITVVRASPPIKCIQVDCVWNYRGRRLFTNTVVTYRCPDAL